MPRKIKDPFKRYQNIFSTMHIFQIVAYVRIKLCVIWCCFMQSELVHKHFPALHKVKIQGKKFKGYVINM